MTDIQEISVKSGIRPSECSCDKCKNLCRTPCLGTPEDINKLLEAGYGNRLTPILWGVGMLVGLTDKPIKMVQPRLENNGWCTFRQPNGLCELHDKGLKPTEGKLATHKPKPNGWSLKKDITWLVAKRWLPLQGMF